MTIPDSILKRWSISEIELTELVDSNPSLRGILLGYVAERQFEKSVAKLPGISESVKDDDHDRKRKGDRRLVFRGTELLVEVKSLQTNLVKRLGPDEWEGKAQVDASDSRFVKLRNGKKLKTTCLLRGEFDVLAVNCFAFGEKWRFAFALNSELPPNQYRKYTKYQRSQLLPTLIPLSWPLKPPFTEDLPSLLNRLLKKGARA